MSEKMNYSEVERRALIALEDSQKLLDEVGADLRDFRINPPSSPANTAVGILVRGSKP